METENTIRYIDPANLDPLPHVKHMPRWDKASPEFTGFVQDIRENGIQHPLLITAENRVVDGETRRQGALAAGLLQVPCSVVPGEQVNEIILRELALRRNLTKGQRAYVVAPMLDAAFDEAQKRRSMNAKKTKPTEWVSFSASPDNYAEIFGFSPETLRQAREIHRLFAGDAALKAEFEPKILDPEKPIGLGAAIAGLAYLQKTDVSERTGGRPADSRRQLGLFTQSTLDTFTRWQYWQGFGDRQREAYFAEVRRAAAGLPQDQVAGLAEYYAKLAHELRKTARTQP